MKDTNWKTIKQLDESIKTLVTEMECKDLTQEDWDIKQERLEVLVDTRTRLYENRQKSLIRPKVVSGIFGLVAIGFIMYYEKTDVITSKAFGFATKMIEG